MESGHEQPRPGLVAVIALELAFGLGGRETAAKLTEQWVGKAQETASKVQASAGSNGVQHARSPNTARAYTGRV